MGVWDVFSKSLLSLTFCTLALTGCAPGLVQDGSIDTSNDWISTDLYRKGGTFVGNPPQQGELVLSRVGDLVSCHYDTEENDPGEGTVVISLYVFDLLSGEWISLGNQVGYQLTMHVSGYDESTLFECRLTAVFDFSASHKCKPADLNNDGAVTFADLDALNSHLNDQNLKGDVNRDGSLDMADSDFVKACVNMSVVSDGIPILSADSASQGGE
jgi:hypothetical protein